MAKKGTKIYDRESSINKIKPIEDLQGKAKNKSPFGLAESETAIENIANDLGLTAADIQDFKG